MKFIDEIKTAADRFQQQAAEIAAILADPGVRLADEAQHYQFRGLAEAAAENLCQLRDLTALSRHSGHNLTLLQLAELLENHSADAPVRFDTGDKPPHHFDTYRGDYNHAALGTHRPTHRLPPPTAGELARAARNATNMPYIAYKGDEVRLYGQSPVWQAEYGESGGRPVVDAHADAQGDVVLVTAEPEPRYRTSQGAAIAGPRLFGRNRPALTAALRKIPTAPRNRRSCAVGKKPAQSDGSRHHSRAAGKGDYDD